MIRLSSFNLSRKAARGLAFSAAVLCLLPAYCYGEDRQELIDKIIATGSLTCAEAATRIANYQLLDTTRDAIVDNLGAVLGIEAGWQRGTENYEKVRGILAVAIAKDELLHGPLFSFTERNTVLRAMSSKSIADLRFLVNYFKTPQGKLYWSGMMDGATCSGILKEALEPPNAPLEAAYLASHQEMTALVARKNVEFHEAYASMSATEKSIFDKGFNVIGASLEDAMVSQMSEYEPTLRKRLHGIVAANRNKIIAAIHAHNGMAVAVSSSDFTVDGAKVATGPALTDILKNGHVAAVDLRLNGHPDSARIVEAVTAIDNSGARLNVGDTDNPDMGKHQPAELQKL